MVSVTYVSADSKRHWQREYWPDLIEFNNNNDKDGNNRQTGADGFIMQVRGMGYVDCRDAQETYHLVTEDFSLHAQTAPGTREPWLQDDAASTPAGLLVHAPLPIQWHIHTLCSAVTFKLSITPTSGPGGSRGQEEELALAPQDREGECSVHHEKNWARSFPARYMWVQAWDEETRRGLCIAGGEALPGIEAYLLTYTDRGRQQQTRESWTFTPPWTFGVLGFSPACTTRHDYQGRQFSLDTSTWTRRIVVESSAPRDTFFQLSAPLPEGHRSNFAQQSFAATHQVHLYKRNWPWQAWTLVLKDTFHHGSLEFGGGYYDDAGKKEA